VEVDFYHTADGKCATKEFISDPKRKDILPYFIKSFSLLEKMGNTLRLPHSRKLSGDIFELRILTKKGGFRFPYFFDREKIIPITHGFQKKFQKTPKDEIDMAEKCRRDYFMRKEQLK
jgi:phage-related protein